MVLRLLIDAVHADETRVIIADNSRIHDFDFVTSAKKQVKGNIYLAKITRVEPSLQAAFVEYGGGKQGFLPFAEIHPDYYQIPMADRKRLLEEVEGEHEGEEEPTSHAGLIPPHQEGDVQPQEIQYNDAESKPETFETLLNETLPEHDFGFAPKPSEPIAEEVVSPILYSDPNPEENAPLSDVPAEQYPVDFSPIPTEEVAHLQETSSHEQGSEFQESVHESTHESPESHEIETLGGDDESSRSDRPVSFHRRYKIQEVIKRNQIVLVQVIKEERGNKGVSLTTFISLAGRYCVLMPNSPKGGGISRKIMSGEDRKRLKEISAELKTARGMSAIIRTAGIDRTRAEIKRDYEYLVKLWESIREQTLSSTAPALIYEEGDLIKRTIRDLYSTDIEEIIVEGEAGYTQAKDFLRMILPSHAPRVKLYQENVPLFYAYNIEDQLASMYDPIVKLRSGGYIVLNPTEALISIDVNSGRSTGERNIEETAAKTNLEAAAEIARQLRLRDLAGLVVIDFIDMMDSRNRRAVERALKDALKLDRAKIQLGRISPFGLLEMSRQRLRPSISEASTMPCHHCQGRGIIRSDTSVTIQIIRAMEKEAASGLFNELKLTISPSLVLYLLNTKRDALSSLEQKYTIRITIQTDDTLPQGNFRIEKIKGAQARRGAPVANVQEPVSLNQSMMDELPPIEEEISHETETAALGEGVPGEERPFRRNRRGGRGRRTPRPFNDRGNINAVNPDGTDVAPSPDAGSDANFAQDNRPPRAENPERGERNNNNRNRRPKRWRDKREHSGNVVNGEGTSQPVAASNVVPYQPDRAYERPAARPSSNSHSVPPLNEQMPQDAKPKKGWWRRIVES
jgi:ribonuclease E